jgi:hypothetical protein
VPGRAALWIDVGVKVALVVLLLVGALSGLDQFQGKAFGARLAVYPLGAAVVPFGWWLHRRRHPTHETAYPYAADILITVPFLIDVAGNAANLYDTIDWWDDANHFLNWALLTAGVAELVRPLALPRWVAIGLCVGFGATAAILWELGEYVAFIRNSDELATAYTDTLGDMVLGLSGAVAATVASFALPHPSPA